MLNKISGLTALAFLLVGCPGPDTNRPHDSDADTDPVAEGTGLMKVVAYILDVPEVCLVTASDVENITTNGGETYVKNTGEEFEVVAPAMYEMVIGDDSKADIYGFNTHTDAQGDVWAASLFSKQAAQDSLTVAEADLFRVFEPGRYRCGYDQWWYDASAPDHKGAYDDHYDLDEQRIEVGQDGKVKPQDDPNMDIVGSEDDYMQVEDDHLVLMVGGEATNDDSPYYLAESTIGKDSFSLTSVDSVFGYVADLQCDKR